MPWNYWIMQPIPKKQHWNICISQKGFTALTILSYICALVIIRGHLSFSYPLPIKEVVCTVHTEIQDQSFLILKSLTYWIIIAFIQFIFSLNLWCCKKSEMYTYCTLYAIWNDSEWLTIIANKIFLITPEIKTQNWNVECWNIIKLHQAFPQKSVKSVLYIVTEL